MNTDNFYIENIDLVQKYFQNNTVCNVTTYLYKALLDSGYEIDAFKDCWPIRVAIDLADWDGLPRARRLVHHQRQQRTLMKASLKSGLPAA